MKHDSGRELIARAIIIENDALLVNQGTNKKTGQKYFALPGGHVDPGESCAQAVARELIEELEATIHVGELALVGESVYAGRKAKENQRHELVLYFRAQLLAPLRESDGRILSPEKSKNFQWLLLSELDAAPVLPVSIKNYLLQQSAAPAYDFHDSTR